MPAQATVTHNYLFQITEVPVKGPKGEAVPLSGRLSNPISLTVDSGNLWASESVGETGEFRVDKFDASSEAFISQLAQPGPSLSFFDNGIAVGHATGEAELYVGADAATENGLEGAVAVYNTAGELQTVWAGADTPAKAFGCFECNGRGGVAVDNSTSIGDWAAGDVYVSAPLQGVVDVFKPEAAGREKYVTQLTGIEPGVPFNGPYGVAVSTVNGDVLVVDGSVVDVFEPTALNEYSYVRQLTGPPGASFGNLSAVAVDPGNGDIYVTDRSAGVVDQFDSSGLYLGHLTGLGTPTGIFSEVEGIAVDPASHDVYVGDSSQKGASVDIFGPSIAVPDVTTGSVSNLAARSSTLNGIVNPDKGGAATCQFVWGTSTSFGKVTTCSAPVAEGETDVPVSVTLNGLQPDTTYHYRLQASNTSGTNPGEVSQDGEFTTEGPGVHVESASTVTSESATLNAAINAHNAPTSYYFQYGTSISYGSDLPASPGLHIGSGEGDVDVGVHLQSLKASTVYHYRVVAISELNDGIVTVEGPDKTFTTQAAGISFTQPDSRAWELVTPPEKHGAGIIAVGNEAGADIQAAEDGGGITYGTTAPLVADPAGSNSPEVNQAISIRRAPGSWETLDIATPHNEGATELATGHTAEYKLFSGDLSLGFLEPNGHTPLPPLSPGSEKTIYLREANGEYRALVTSANVVPGAKFGGDGEGAGAVRMTNATPDFSHVVIGSGDVALTSTPSNECGSVMWTGGNLTCTGGDVLSFRHAISDDGSRVIGGGFEGHAGLDLHDMIKKETVQVDAAQGVPEPTSSESLYRTANDKDSRVFFTNSERLTADSTASEGEDLYEFEVINGETGSLTGKLTDLTVDQRAGESAEVQGVIGASEDGSYVYFVANGVLGDGAEHGVTHGNCESMNPASGQKCNLYVGHYIQTAKTWASPVFIATLSGNDAPSWGRGPDLKEMTSRVSPNGRYLAFMSESSLTGYENRDASSGTPDEEVFLYDADANEGTGRLVCASCDPTGAQPVGLFEGDAYEENLVDYAKTWSGRWFAANIPGWTTEDLTTALYQSRYLSNSGRLFFNSSDSLVPADVNGKEDVYEFEPDGVGSCQPPGYGQSASDVFVEGIGGCVALISAGTSSEESAFMDASESGGDVFFLTLSQLSPQDFDTSVDLYDAHECTPSAPCVPAPASLPPPCTTGDACKPALTPQPAGFGAPSSETFSGAGNIVGTAPASTLATKSSSRAHKLAKALTACRKKHKRRRATCERQARKRYGAKKSQTGKSLSARTRR
ncbi:MAG TPA: hypothetical protein VK781_06515 [Solirubrobacteraceae bacterium]|nr:hypothetical protein [Solirubrobacteraceae bacterium]